MNSCCAIVCGGENYTPPESTDTTPPEIDSPVTPVVFLQEHMSKASPLLMDTNVKPIRVIPTECVVRPLPDEVSDVLHVEDMTELQRKRASMRRISDTTVRATHQLRPRNELQYTFTPADPPPTTELQSAAVAAGAAPDEGTVVGEVATVDGGDEVLVVGDTECVADVDAGSGMPPNVPDAVHESRIDDDTETVDELKGPVTCYREKGIAASLDEGLDSVAVRVSGGAARTVASMRAAQQQLGGVAKSVAHISRSAASRLRAPATGLIGVARSREAGWRQLDMQIEASILDGVPEENLKPTAKPARSEKATMLLYGYVSEADRAALRTTSTTTASSGVSLNDDAALEKSGSKSLRIANSSESDDDDNKDPTSIAQRTSSSIQAFLDKENEIENRRFVAERWADKVTFVQSYFTLKNIFIAIYQAKSIEFVITPQIRRRLKLWLKASRVSRSVRDVVERSSSFQCPRVATCCKEPTLPFRTPPAAWLRKSNPLLADWPVSAVEWLLQRGTPTVLTAHTAVFLEGDPTEDAFLLCHGEVDLVVMRTEYFAKKVFHHAYYSQQQQQLHQDQDHGDISIVPSSKRRLETGNAGACVVAHVAELEIFGLDSPVLQRGEPRCCTAWATTNGTALRFKRNDIMLAMQQLPDLSFQVAQRTAWGLRHQYLYGTAFPIPTDILTRASPIFRFWHHSALQDIHRVASIEVQRKGDVIVRQGDVAPVGMAKVMLILRGRVELSIAAAPHCHPHHHHSSHEQGTTPGGGAGGSVTVAVLGPMDVIGDEELILCGAPARFTATCQTSAEFYTITQNEYLEVARVHGDCATFARDAVRQRIANRLVKPTNPPSSLLKDHVLEFLLPQPLLQHVWCELAEPVYFLQGDSICRTWDEATHMYFFVAGTMFQAYGADGPHVPVVSRGDVMHGAVSDEVIQSTVQDATFGMDEADGLYAAIQSPGALNRAASSPTKGGGRHPIADLAAVHQTGAWVPLERNLHAGGDEEGDGGDVVSNGGVVLGAVEFALGVRHCLSHVRATSAVVGWRWSRRALEQLLRSQCPPIWDAIQHPKTVASVKKHFLQMTLKLLTFEAAPRSAM